MNDAVSVAVDQPGLRPRAVVNANAVGGKVRSVLVVVAVLGSEYVDGVCAGHGDEEAGGSEDLESASEFSQVWPNNCAEFFVSLLLTD